MKKVMIGFSAPLLLLVLATNTFAAEYQCRGIDEASPRKEKYESTLEVAETKITFSDSEGTDASLDRFTRNNERALNYAVYADYEYDGYGGFMKLSIPKNVARSPYPILNSFTAYYDQTIYSELGKVGEVRVVMTCSVGN